MQVGLAAFDCIDVGVNNRGGNESINKTNNQINAVNWLFWKRGLEVSVANLINCIFIVD